MLLGAIKKRLDNNEFPAAGLIAVGLHPGTKNMVHMSQEHRLRAWAAIREAAVVLCVNGDVPPPQPAAAVVPQLGLLARMAQQVPASAAAVAAAAPTEVKLTAVQQVDLELAWWAEQPEVACPDTAFYGPAIKTWQQHAARAPRLAALARRILCIPATGAPVEGMWSAAGDLVSRKRSRFTPTCVEQLVFLRANRHAVFE